MARVLLTAGKGLGWAARLALIKERFGTDGTSEPSLVRVKGG